MVPDRLTTGRKRRRKGTQKGTGSKIVESNEGAINLPVKTCASAVSNSGNRQNAIKTEQSSVCPSVSWINWVLELKHTRAHTYLLVFAYLQPAAFLCGRNLRPNCALEMCLRRIWPAWGRSAGSTDEPLMAEAAARVANSSWTNLPNDSHKDRHSFCGWPFNLEMPGESCSQLDCVFFFYYAEDFIASGGKREAPLGRPVSFSHRLHVENQTVFQFFFPLRYFVVNS